MPWPPYVTRAGGLGGLEGGQGLGVTCALATVRRGQEGWGGRFMHMRAHTHTHTHNDHHHQKKKELQPLLSKTNQFGVVPLA